jgi:hypothetical protein
MSLFLLLLNVLALINLLEENTTATNFNDMGKLLLGGVVAALVVAIAFTLVRFKLRDKRPPTSSFISIASPHEKPGE